MPIRAERALRPWVTFAGLVLVVFVLSWAKAVLVPMALASLLAFVLSPPVVWLERRVSRVPAVLLMVTLVFGTLGLVGWGVARQVGPLAEGLPRYGRTIHAKLAVARAGRSGPLERLQRTVESIASDIAGPKQQRSAPATAVVVDGGATDAIPRPAWLDPLLEPLATSVVIFGLVVFMLLERRSLRDRLLALIGHGHLAATTRAITEAGSRVSRQLLMQTLVNLTYGLAVGTGLFFIGVPFAWLWAALAALLRFIPYAGPVLGACAPILVSFGALPGWSGPLLVLCLFVVLELLTSMVLETVLYAGAAGVSQVALLVSLAFWAWLWGPLGLLMATPLTVCLVVLGKHVPGMEMIGTMLADSHVLAPEYSYYQRLLARDQLEAVHLIERYLKSESAETVYDAILLPALNYAERDRLEGRLSSEQEEEVVAATRELVVDAAELSSRLAAPPANGVVAAGDPLPEGPPLTVLGYASVGAPGEVALQMLSRLLAGVPLDLQITAGRLRAGELLDLVRERRCAAVCIVDLPPSSATQTHYLVRRLRAALPDLPIVVGRWAPSSLADEAPGTLLESGASRVSASLIDTRDFLKSQLTGR